MVPTAKLTARQESYCQHLVGGLNQTTAYRAAGYSVDNKLPATVYQAASRLAANSKVVARIRELRDAVTLSVTEKRAWDSVRLIDAAEEHMLQARRDKQFAAANGALRLIGTAAGLLEAQPQAAVPITKVTVLLNGYKREALEDDTAALEASYQMLPQVNEPG